MKNAPQPMSTNPHSQDFYVSPAAEIVSTERGPIEALCRGDGPTVLALHGAMGGYDQSHLLTLTVAEPRFRCVSMSRPGYLGTPASVGLDLDAQADACAALLDTLGLDDAVLMAVSGGGPCALRFALRHRERCSGLVLASTPGGPMEARIPLSFLATKRLARWGWFVEKMRARVEKNLDQVAKRSITDDELRARTMADPEVGPLFRGLLMSTWSRMSERLDGTENDIRVSRTTEYPLEDIAVPTLVVHGTRDPLLPFTSHGQRLASRIPSAELFVAEGGEHAAIFTHRDAVRARVTAFLDATAGR